MSDKHDDDPFLTLQSSRVTVKHDEQHEERAKEFVLRLKDKLAGAPNSPLMEHYAHLVEDHFGDFWKVLASFGLANQRVFEQMWKESYGEDCPFDAQQGANAAKIICNMVAIGLALDQMMDEEKPLAAMSQDQINQMFSRLEVSGDDEKGN